MAIKTLPEAWLPSIASLNAGLSVGVSTVGRSKGSEEAAPSETSRTGTGGPAAYSLKSSALESLATLREDWK